MGGLLCFGQIDRSTRVHRFSSRRTCAAVGIVGESDGLDGRLRVVVNFSVNYGLIFVFPIIRRQGGIIVADRCRVDQFLIINITLIKCFGNIDNSRTCAIECTSQAISINNLGSCVTNYIFSFAVTSYSNLVKQGYTSVRRNHNFVVNGICNTSHPIRGIIFIFYKLF